MTVLLGSEPHHELALETARHLFVPLSLSHPETAPSDEAVMSYAYKFYGLGRFKEGNRADRLAKFIIVDGYEETILDENFNGGIQTYRGNRGASCRREEVPDDVWDLIEVSKKRHRISEAYHLGAATADDPAVEAMQVLDSIGHHAVIGVPRKNNGRPYDLHQLEAAAFMWDLTGRFEQVSGITIPMRDRYGLSFTGRPHDSLEFEFKRRRANPVDYYSQDTERIVTTARVIKSILEEINPLTEDFPDPSEVASAIRQMSFVLINGSIGEYLNLSAGLGGNIYANANKGLADNPLNTFFEPMDLDKALAGLSGAKREKKHLKLETKRWAMIDNIIGKNISHSPNSALHKERGGVWAAPFYEFGRTAIYDPDLLKDPQFIERYGKEFDLTHGSTAEEMRKKMPKIVRDFKGEFKLPTRDEYVAP